MVTIRRGVNHLNYSGVDDEHGAGKAWLEGSERSGSLETYTMPGSKGNGISLCVYGDAAGVTRGTPGLMAKESRDRFRRNGARTVAGVVTMRHAGGCTIITTDEGSAFYCYDHTNLVSGTG